MNELTMSKTQWKKYIQEAHGNTKEAMLEEAKRIAEYKANCDTKQGGSTFARDVEEWCGYEQSTANKMAKIGRDDELRAICPKLPESYRTIHEITTLPPERRETLPISPSLTRAQVKNWREFGRLTAPKLPAPEPDDEQTELQQAANLVGDLESLGFTGLSKRAMEQARDKLNEGLNSFARTNRKKVLDFLIEYMHFWQRLMNREVLKATQARTKALDAREERIRALEDLRVNSADNTSVKMIQQILHPDRAPEGQKQKYAKAFKAFKELTG